MSQPSAPHRLRWWPAFIIAIGALGVVTWIRTRDQIPFQQRNLQTLGAAAIAVALLLVWWGAFSRAPGKWRLAGFAVIVAILALAAASYRIRGVDGDLVPILEPRWSPRAEPANRLPPANHPGNTSPSATPAHPDFPQFLGPNRTGVLPGPPLDAGWAAHPPQILWKKPIGAGWSGFVIIGNRAVTQEQGGDQELVTCYDVTTGQRLWAHPEPAHYQTVIAGEGPRATPAVASNRVYALGATGILNCLDLGSGRPLWRRTITADSGATMPDWGFAGSPLVLNNRVLVSAGGKPERSLLAYHAETGELEWARGNSSMSYASPFFATLAGQDQILMFNARRITSHAMPDGVVLWEYPWGIGQPHVSIPVIIGTNRMIFSSGYGVGAECLEFVPGATNAPSVRRIWKSNRMKAKFSNLVAHDGFLYGLDDGVMACVDVRDGSLRWKEGRYGHGQGLWVERHYLLMAESGELILLQPSPAGPNEQGRFRVFTDKTWNPLALSGPHLLVRNDREAACLSIPLLERRHQAGQ